MFNRYQFPFAVILIIGFKNKLVSGLGRVLLSDKGLPL